MQGAWWDCQQTKAVTDDNFTDSLAAIITGLLKMALANGRLYCLCLALEFSSFTASDLTDAASIGGSTSRRRLYSVTNHGLNSNRFIAL